MSALANTGATLISSHGMGSFFFAQDAKDEAMAKAVEDARKKPTLLAEAAGMSLTSITQISAISPYFTRPLPTLMRAELALDSTSSSTFVPGNLSFVAEVAAQAKAE